MILSADATPIPPSGVVERLQEIDSNLGLKYVNGVLGESWALTWRWPMGDKRWQRVQTGEIKPENACDVYAYLPIECSPSEAAGWAERNLRRFAGTSHEIDRMLDQLDKHNAGVKQAHLDKIRELGHELFTTNAATLFHEEGKRIPKVFMNEWRAKKIKKPKPIDLSQMPEDL